jgi:hypothetical protein
MHWSKKEQQKTESKSELEMTLYSSDILDRGDDEI